MSNIIQVSPKFQLNRETWKITNNKQSFKFDSKDAARLVFQDRMQGWFFDPAKTLIDSDQIVVAVHIVTPLIEALENYIRGESSKNQSSKFFMARAELIFPFLDKTAIDILYYGVRCGFAHQGFLKDDSKTDNILPKTNNILISSGKADNSIVYRKPEMIIYAGQYVADIQKSFEEYFSLLETDKNELDQFFVVWEKQWNMKSLTMLGTSGTLSS